MRLLDTYMNHLGTFYGWIDIDAVDLSMKQKTTISEIKAVYYDHYTIDINKLPSA